MASTQTRQARPKPPVKRSPAAKSATTRATARPAPKPATTVAARPAATPAAKPKTTTATKTSSSQPASRPRRPAARPIQATATTVRDRRGPKVPWGSGATPQVLSGGKYQNIILAEFIGTLLLTVLTPIAKDDAKEGLSPYAGADMVKLASMVLLFFLLALVSSAGPGAARLAAWLGGLVLIADGLYEASNLSKDLSLFTGFLNRASNSGDSNS